jgi:ABC-type dipeptide/oligopeptide/nickel transport system permease component
VLSYLSSRVIGALLVVLVSASLVFFLIRLSGDPVQMMLGETSGVEQAQALRHSLGLDKPLAAQYVTFLSNAVRGDFGRSFRYDQPALSLVLERLPATLELTLGALLLSILVAVPLGIAAAVRRGSLIDWLASILAVAGQSTPIFLLGLLLILIFAVNLHWLPSSGREKPILPMVSLAAYSLPLTMRILRSSMLDALNRDYIRTARAKGLTEKVVIYVHALRNALIPVVTVIGMRMGFLIGGAVITEKVFGYPGVGRLALQALSYRDFPVIQAFIAVIALLVAGLNLFVDILYSWLDPRIRVKT